jgi:YbbR domain-containing protein
MIDIFLSAFLAFFFALFLWLIQTVKNLEKRLSCLEGKIDMIINFLNMKK